VARARFARLRVARDHERIRPFGLPAAGRYAMSRLEASRSRAMRVRLACVLLALAGCAPDRSSDAVLASQQSKELARDSARAVTAATAMYEREADGIPVHVRGVRREGEDHVATFYPGGDWVGGDAVIRVKRDGTTILEEIGQ